MFVATESIEQRLAEFKDMEVFLYLMIRAKAEVLLGHYLTTSMSSTSARALTC